MPSIILFISDTVPTMQQCDSAKSLGYEILHKSLNQNPFSISPFDFHKFIHSGRVEATKLNQSANFGVEQRDIVIYSDHTAIVAMAIDDGHTVALFDEENSIHFYDPQFFAPFVHTPYTPPPIPDRQEISDEERAEMVANRQKASVGATDEE